MIFRWTFETTDNKIESVDYLLYENELVEAWKGIFEFSGNNNTDFYGLGSQSAEDTIKRNYPLLEPYLKDEDKNIDVLVLDTQTLNRLHRIFHYYGEENCPPDEERFPDKGYYGELLKELNIAIHKLEVTGDNSFMGVFSPKRNPQRVFGPDSVEIPESWYRKYFNDRPVSGELLLGYATIGKDLLNSYIQDDLDNLNNLAYQKYIRQEIRIWFSEHQEKPGRLKQAWNWALSNGYQLTDAEKYCRRPKLGKIVTDLSHKEARLLFSKYKRYVSWEFLTYK
tara:strand:- start:1681 stop:2523 length:843 start_codon:yes stop_codon:yes gene_type:complete